MSGNVIASNSARLQLERAPLGGELKRDPRRRSARKVQISPVRCGPSTSLSATGSSSGSNPVSAANRSERNVAIRSSQFLPPRS